MQDPDGNEVLTKAIQSSFEIESKLSKDNGIIGRNSSKFEVYRSKYIKLGKQLIATLSFHLDKEQERPPISSHQKKV